MKIGKLMTVMLMLVGLVGVLFGVQFAVSSFFVDRARQFEEVFDVFGLQAPPLVQVLIEKFSGPMAVLASLGIIGASSMLFVAGALWLRDQLCADAAGMERELATRKALEAALEGHLTRLTDLLVSRGVLPVEPSPELRRLAKPESVSALQNTPQGSRLVDAWRQFGLEPPEAGTPELMESRQSDPAEAPGIPARPIAVGLFSLSGVLVLWAILMALTYWNSDPLAQLGLTTTPGQMLGFTAFVLATSGATALTGAGVLQLRQHDERLAGRREAALSGLGAERLAAYRRRLDRSASAEPADLERRLVRAHTLDALSGQDGGGKRQVLQLLRESGRLGGSTGVDLTGADLRDADLSDLDLSDARLAGANLRRANLQQARLDGVDLSGGDLCWADLRDARLGGARLHQANLYGARLHAAYMRRADLTSASLEGANLWQADLDGADLRHARVSAQQLQAARSTRGAELDSPTGEGAAAEVELAP